MWSRLLLHVPLLLLLVRLPAPMALGRAPEPLLQRLPSITKNLQRNDHRALPAARAILSEWLQADPDNPSLKAFHSRLHVIRSLCERMNDSLQEKGQDALRELVGDVVQERHAPDSSPVGKTAQIAPAEQLYAEYLPAFSRPLDKQGLAEAEIAFLQTYYDAEVRAMIGDLMALGAKFSALDAESHALESYLVLLPLLHSRHDFDVSLLRALPGWAMTPERLQILRDFCLMKLGRLDAAAAIETHFIGRDTSEQALCEYYIAAADRCAAAKLPGLAVQCLKRGIDLLGREDSRRSELLFKTCSVWADHDNFAAAAGEAATIAHELRDPQQVGKARCLRLVYLARQGDHKAVILEVDDALDDERCQPYAQDLLYIRWYALRKDGRQEQAHQAKEQYLARYGESEYAGDMFYADAIDCISDGRNEEALTILRALSQKYPHSGIARKAGDLMKSLEKLE